VTLLPPPLAHAEPFVFTNTPKVDLIQSLAIAIEQRQVSWPAPILIEGGRSSPTSFANTSTSNPAAAA
jgi:hypothetical protein